MDASYGGASAATETTSLRSRDPERNPLLLSQSDDATGEKGDDLAHVHGRATERRTRRAVWTQRIKLLVIVSVLLTSLVLFASNAESELTQSLVSVPSAGHGVSLVEVESGHTYYEIDLTFNPIPVELDNGTAIVYNLFVGVVGRDAETDEWITLAAPEDYWVVDLSQTENEEEEMTERHRFLLQPSYHHYALNMSTSDTVDHDLALKIYGGSLPSAIDDEVIFAALILIFVYFLIIFDLVHRTLAAMIGAFLTLGVLAALNKRPSLDEVVEWIDFETISLLFGMMVMVGIFSTTGFFEYAAVKAYKISRGRVWFLLTILCTFSAVVSAFLDNVTTVLLMSPVTIRLCEVMNLSPQPVLIAIVLFSNIGGTSTAVGDPPNVIIVSDSTIAKSGMNFSLFTGHMFVGSIFVFFVGYAWVRLFSYRNVDFSSPDSPHVAELRREILIWRKSVLHLTSQSQEESHVRQLLEQKIAELEQVLETAQSSGEDDWLLNVKQLEAQYRIKDPVLFVTSSCVLVVVIIFFFIHSIPGIHLDLGWIAIIGAIFLLLLSGVQEIDHFLEKVEWSTLLFFAALFVLMEGLSELGLISWIGARTADMIRAVPAESRLAVAIIVILWISAIASSFIDNIPFTTAMIPIIIQLADDPALGLPLHPLVYALAFGACLGGNGTLIGASANVVTAGLAESAGYPFSFSDFFKTGFPLMLVTTFAAMIYLLLCHVAGSWD